MRTPRLVLSHSAPAVRHQRLGHQPARDPTGRQHVLPPGADLHHRHPGRHRAAAIQRGHHRGGHHHEQLRLRPVVTVDHGQHGHQCEHHQLRVRLRPGREPDQQHQDRHRPARRRLGPPGDAAIGHPPPGKPAPCGHHRLLPGHGQTEPVQPAKAIKIRRAERSVRRVEVFRDDGVRTPILGRPRPPPRNDAPNSTPSTAKSQFTAPRQ